MLIARPRRSRESESERICIYRANTTSSVWTQTDTSTPHFEQAHSEDGGKTWEVNWVTDQTRVTASPSG